MANYCKHNSGVLYSPALGRWTCANCGASMEEIQKALVNEFEEAVNNSSQKVKKCECGGDKAKTTHARYCPKWNIP